MQLYVQISLIISFVKFFNEKNPEISYIIEFKMSVLCFKI